MSERFVVGQRVWTQDRGWQEYVVRSIAGRSYLLIYKVCQKWDDADAYSFKVSFKKAEGNWFSDSGKAAELIRLEESKWAWDFKPKLVRHIEQQSLDKATLLRIAEAAGFEVKE